MKITPSRIREIRERCEKAPAGPWKWSPHKHLVNTKGIVITGCDADAFIAHARTDLPDALNDLEEAKNDLLALVRAIRILSNPKNWGVTQHAIMVDYPELAKLIHRASQLV